MAPLRLKLGSRYGSEWSRSRCSRFIPVPLEFGTEKTPYAVYIFLEMKKISAPTSIRSYVHPRHSPVAYPTKLPRPFF